MGTIRLERGHFGLFRIVNDDGREILVQEDWDYPATASVFGHALRSKRLPDGPNKLRRYCRHDSTDGTVKCDDCGRTATEFITETANWLDENIGVTAEDPGYFE